MYNKSNKTQKSNKKTHQIRKICKKNYLQDLCGNSGYNRLIYKDKKRKLLYWTELKRIELMNLRKIDNNDNVNATSRIELQGKKIRIFEQTNKEKN